MDLEGHIALHYLVCFEHSVEQLCIIWCLDVAEKIFDDILKSQPCDLLNFIRLFFKFGIFHHFPDLRANKMPSCNLASLILGNNSCKYLNALPLLFNALIKFFIKPSFM